MGVAAIVVGFLLAAALFISCVENISGAIRRRRKQQFKSLVRQRNELKREITAAQKKRVAKFLVVRQRNELKREITAAQKKRVAKFLAWCKRNEDREGRRRAIQA